MEEFKITGRIRVVVTSSKIAEAIAESVDPENSLLTKMDMKTRHEKNEVITEWTGVSSIWTLKNTLDDLIASIILASETAEVLQKSDEDYLED